MAKVGILSMQRIANYGSFLQAYALKTMLEEQGHEVQFVDYHIEKPLLAEESEYKNTFVRKAKKGFEAFAYHAPLTHKIRFILFKQFFEKKYLPLLGVKEQRNYTPMLDCLLIGSDEVFNCVQKNANVGYSLELFGKNNCAKKLMSYAASFGNTTFDKLEHYEKTKEIGQLLKRFDMISVRDSNSGSIVRKLTGKMPEYHLDPVLVYDYVGKCNYILDIHLQEKYLILYAYSGRVSNDEADWIAAYAKKKKLKVYAVGGIQKCAERFINCSPFEVIAYFKNAEAVITDTFHGSIFSIITHRRFVTLVRKSAGNVYGNEEKLTDLLGRLGLKERMIENIDSANIILERDINYQEIDDLLYSERQRTERYFQENILL